MWSHSASGGGQRAHALDQLSNVCLPLRRTPVEYVEVPAAGRHPQLRRALPVGRSKTLVIQSGAKWAVGVNSASLAALLWLWSAEDSRLGCMTYPMHDISENDEADFVLRALLHDISNADLQTTGLARC